MTFEEINNLWVESGLSYGEGDDLPLRTFHNHRRAIKDIFNVYIECDTKGGYKYYIDEPELLEGDSLRSWLIDSYATLNQIQADKQRWYVIGRNPYYAWKKEKAEAEGKTYNEPIFRVYGLDRISNVYVTDKKFEMDKEFLIEDLYDGCCGIIPNCGTHSQYFSEINKKATIISLFLKLCCSLAYPNMHLCSRTLLTPGSWH